MPARPTPNFFTAARHVTDWAMLLVSSLNLMFILTPHGDVFWENRFPNLYCTFILKKAGDWVGVGSKTWLLWIGHDTPGTGTHAPPIIEPVVSTV